jgi:hypothetical protein
MKSLRLVLRHKSSDEESDVVNYILDYGKKASHDALELVAGTGKFTFAELTDWDVKVLETKRFIGVIFENEEYIFKKPKKEK